MQTHDYWSERQGINATFNSEGEVSGYNAYLYHCYHKHCAEQKRQEEQEQHEEQEKRAKEYRQQQEVQHAKQAAENRKQEKQQHKERQEVMERAQRASAGLCMICGRVYSISDEPDEKWVADKDLFAHVKCKDKPFSWKGADDKNTHRSHMSERRERGRRNVCMVCGKPYNLLNPKVNYRVTYPPEYRLLTLSRYPPRYLLGEKTYENISAHKNCKGKAFQKQQEPKTLLDWLLSLIFKA